MERKQGVEGYRDTQRALAEMAEKSSEVDQMKGALVILDISFTKDHSLRDNL